MEMQESYTKVEVLGDKMAVIPKFIDRESFVCSWTPLLNDIKERWEGLSWAGADFKLFASCEDVSEV